MYDSIRLSCCATFDICSKYVTSYIQENENNFETMLSFLQNIIVGGGTITKVEEESEDEEERNFSTSNRKEHRQQQKTDDQIADELLEQFPRYGSFASSLQQQESVHAAVMASFGTNNNTNNDNMNYDF